MTIMRICRSLGLAALFAGALCRAAYAVPLDLGDRLR